MGAANYDQIHLVLKRLCEDLGLDGYTWWFHDGEGQYIELDTRPAEWKQLYEDGFYILSDPVVLTAFTTMQPFLWSEALARRKMTPREMSVMGQAQHDFGIAEGCNFPIHDPEGQQGSLSFFCRDLHHLFEVWKERHHLLSYISYLCHMASKRLDSRKKDKDNGPRLTAREREILTYAAAGLSRDEIADKIGRDVNTVKAHLQSANRKLDTSKTIHAAIKAFTQGEIVGLPALKPRSIK